MLDSKEEEEKERRDKTLYCSDKDGHVDEHVQTQHDHLALTNLS